MGIAALNPSYGDSELAHHPPGEAKYTALAGQFDQFNLP